METLPIVEFEKIENPHFPICPEEVIESLNTDQKYSYKVCQCIMTGHVPKGFEEQKAGKMCHARWLTTGGRIGRVYISEENPSSGLKRLTNYIIKVYMPTWLNVHWHHNIKYASQHLLNEIKLIQQHCTEAERSIALKIVNINAFAGHPEMVLTCILMSTNEQIRQDAVNKVFTIRRDKEEKRKVADKKDVKMKKKKVVKKKAGIRKLKVPKLNFKATKISEVCPWKDATEPNITSGLSNEELLKFTEAPLELQNIPCHTQAVEREVKLTTQASAAVAGIENQQGFAFNVIAARKAMK